MLAKLIGASRWNWTAFGKHIVAKDYFQINLQSPIAKAFAQWVDNGFRALPEEKRRHTVCSWRFWTRGQKKGTALCGLTKSSCDSIGRPYPMTLIGEGALDRWEKSWELMLVGLEETWQTLEYTVARRLKDLDQLENEIGHLESPQKKWWEARHLSGPHQMGDNLRWEHKKIIVTNVRNKARSLDRDGRVVISLDNSDKDTPFQLATLWHTALKASQAPLPSTVFMGGGMEKTMLALFNRPLIQDDFVFLWSA